MTVVCSGGTSSARPGYGAFVYMAPSAVAALLNNIPTLWAVPLAAAIGLVTFEMATFCTDDPPAMPTFTSSDVVDLLNYGDIVAQIAAANKFRDMIGAFMWPTLCQCDTVATPAIPAAPAQPTGMPNVNPVTPVTPDPNLSTPCYHWCHSCAPFSTLDVFFDVTASFPKFNVLGVQSGMTGIQIDLAWTVPGGASAVTIAFTIAQMDWADNVLQTTTGTVGSAAPFSQFLPLDPNTDHITLTYASPTGRPSTVVLHTNADGFCNGERPGGSSDTACCPPDPIIEQLLQNILGIVTLVQRQVAPFGYVASTAHSGLTGNGHFDVSGLIGVKVQLDSTSSYTGIEDADPDLYFEAGWINWSNDDGARKREFISASPFVSLPPLAGQYTRIGYTLPVGVSATITELVREA